MMCQRCQSSRVARVNGKTSDSCDVRADGHDSDGYVPSDMNIGGGDYLRFSYCLNCGQLQGTFPISPEQVRKCLAPDGEDDWDGT